MRRMFAAAILTLAAGCGSAPTKQEANLSKRGEGAEQMPGASANEITPGTLPPAEQNAMGDTMPDKPGGPTSDTAGAGGDSVPSQ